MKGTIIDLIPVIIIIFGLLIGLVVASQLYTAFSQTELLDSSYNAQIEASFTILDYGSIFLVVGLVIAIVIGAFLIYTHPVFIVPSIIILFVILMIAPVLTNSYMAFASSPDIVATANQFPMTLYTIDYIPIIVFFAGIIILIALYMKPGGGGV